MGGGDGGDPRGVEEQQIRALRNPVFPCCRVVVVGGGFFFFATRYEGGRSAPARRPGDFGREQARSRQPLKPIFMALRPGP